MSEELKSMVEDIGKSIHDERKKYDELSAKLEKNEGGQAEIKAQLAKIEEQSNELLNLRDEQKQMSAAIQRLGASAEEKSEENGVKFDKKGFEQGLRIALKKGNIQRLDGLGEAEVKAMSSVIDPDGGYTVTPFMDSMFKTRLFDTSPVRSLANVVSIGTNAYECILDDEEAGAEWVGELSSRAATTTPQFGKISVPVHILHANIQITDSLLEDSAVDLMSWAGRKAADKFGRSEATAFVDGNGVDRPRGFLQYTEKTSNPEDYARDQIGTKVAAGAAAVTTDELVELRSLLQAGYRGNAYFAYNRATEAIIRKLKDGQNNYIWQPVYAEGEADQLLGQRTVIMEDMPDMTTGNKAIVLADFRECYTIVDRIGMQLLDDPYSNVPYRTLRFKRRIGGGITNFAACKYLKQA